MDAQAFGRELGVDSALEGTIQKAGELNTRDRGEKEQAVGWLRKLKEKDGMKQIMLRDDPRLDGLPSDPGFRELL